MRRGRGWNRPKWPDEPKPVFILPVHESEAGGDDRREACGEFQAQRFHSSAVLIERHFHNPNS